MASTITVTVGTLNTKASELRQYNASLKTKIDELSNTENTLNGMWEGEAKTAFHNAFHKDLVQMQNFYNAIEKYASSLTEIAKQYEAAETKNINIASTRKY